MAYDSINNPVKLTRPALGGDGSNAWLYECPLADASSVTSVGYFGGGLEELGAKHGDTMEIRFSDNSTSLARWVHMVVGTDPAGLPSALNLTDPAVDSADLNTA